MYPQLRKVELPPLEMSVEGGKIEVGMKVKINKWKRPLRIRATDGVRFIIASQPFMKKNVLYSIIDLKERRAGKDNYHTRFNYLDVKECEEALLHLQNKKSFYEGSDSEFTVSFRSFAHIESINITR